MALVFASYAFRDIYHVFRFLDDNYLFIFFLNFLMHSVLTNQIWKSWRCQHVLVSCAIVDKGNIEVTIFGILIMYLLLLCMHVLPRLVLCDLCGWADLCDVKTREKHWDDPVLSGDLQMGQATLTRYQNWYGILKLNGGYYLAKF